jgi:hypothetical protein
VEATNHSTAQEPDRKSYCKSQQKIKQHCKTCDHLSSLAAAAHRSETEVQKQGRMLAAALSSDLQLQDS